ncbi:2Fe-2S iron-sulfur cluster-binding protein [Ulvibacter litoralis]|uniref:2Fe-2S iron-sulfur cluster-binding protein n=1 Tax=Ulvibacter litoralis TaxID=227084 RepID=UPI000B88028E|nr:2Fe-2S iron-sulfur cluster-binding protein [Ulvibacter litoralis]
MNTFYTLTVSEVKRETPNAVSITLQIPNDLKEKFSFKAGQYITMKHQANGTEIRRAYSICSAPNSGVLKVGVKKVENGLFSTFANNDLKAGDTLEVLPPAGKFTVSPELGTVKNYAAFVAGSGITPVLSIVQTVLEEAPNSTFLLVYGNQSPSETMFFSNIKKLQEDYPNRLSVQYVFSREDAENAHFGRIDRSVVNLMLRNKYKDTQFDDFYLCGPETMIDEVSSTLKENHVNTKQIHFELFTTSEGDLLVEAHDGNTKVTVTLDDETETFTMPQNKSVLEAALENKLDAPFSCQGGICSTCIARVIEGKAEMRKNQILTDGEIAEGLILTCQAHPTTPTLVIDYDDV